MIETLIFSSLEFQEGMKRYNRISRGNEIWKGIKSQENKTKQQ